MRLVSCCDCYGPPGTCHIRLSFTLTLQVLNAEETAEVLAAFRSFLHFQHPLCAFPYVCVTPAMLDPFILAGVVQPMAEIGKLCRSKGVFFHTDAAQAVGKVPVDVNAMNIDLMSISGHKIYGPKGIGALYVRRRPRVRLEPMMSGGGQERGLRSGTVPAFLTVGLGKACQVAQQVGGVVMRGGCSRRVLLSNLHGGTSAYGSCSRGPYLWTACMILQESSAQETMHGHVQQL